MRSRADDAGPNEPVPMPSKLVEDVIVLLEEAGCPDSVNNKITQLIEEWEAAKNHYNEPDYPEPPPHVL